MKRVGMRAVFWASILSGVLFATESRADVTSTAPLAQSLTGEGKADYESARLLFDDGDYLGALAKFSQAYDVSHDPRLLWNMAVCEKEVRHYARTATLIARYLDEGGTRITKQQRQGASETQAALRSFYAAVKLSGAADGAIVFLDGKRVGETPLKEALLVDLGSRALRVEQAGFEPFETTLEVAGGGQLEVPIAMKPLAPATVTPARLSIVTSRATDIVALDGKVLGSHSWQGVVTVGEHIVRVTGEGKKPYEAHVQVLAGSTRSLQITLEDADRRSNIWLWVAGGAVVATGFAVGGYFLFKPQDSPGPHPEGKLTTIYLSLGR
jgi:hypothetical protein